MESDEDEEGYIDCQFDSDRARERGSEEDGSGDDMNSKKKRRSKSLERLSNLSIRPSAGEANSLTSSRSHQEFARRPRIPPRPSTQVLSRFKQQRDSLVVSSPGASPRSSGKPGNPVKTKYVELDVLPAKENAKGVRNGGAATGSPHLHSSSKSRTAPRTSYAMLQLPDEGSNSPSSNSRRTSGQPHSRKTVQRSKSNALDQPLYSEYKTPRNSAAYPAATSDSWERPLHLETEAPPSRKPKKTYSTASLYPTTHRTPPLPPRGSTLEDNSAATFRTVSEASHRDQHTTAPHIIDLRTGTATYRNGSDSPHTSAGEAGISTTPPSVATVHLSGQTSHHRHTHHEPLLSDIGTCQGEGSVNRHEKLQFRRPPPPSRRPPARPPAPIPQPRKPRTQTTSPSDPESDQYIQMVSPRVMSPASGSGSIQSGKPSLSGSGGVVNTTAFPRSSGGPREGGGAEGVREAQSNTTDVSGEYDGAYSYVDLVKNRRLIVTIASNPPDPKSSARHEGELQTTSVKSGH